MYSVKRAELKSYALFTVNVEVDGKECVVLSCNHLGHSVAVHRLKVRGEVYVGKVGSLRDSCVGFGAHTRGEDNVNERADLKSGFAVSFVILVVLGEGNLAELYAVERLCLNEHYVGGYVKNLARLCSGAIYENKIVAVYYVNNVVDGLIRSASFHYVKACKGVGEHCLYRVVVKLFVVAADGLKLRGKSYCGKLCAYKHVLAYFKRAVGSAVCKINGFKRSIRECVSADNGNGCGNINGLESRSVECVFTDELNAGGHIELGDACGCECVAADSFKRRVGRNGNA